MELIKILSDLSQLSLESILKIYGLLCLICLPVSLIGMIIMYRKRPDLVEGFNKSVDKLLDGNGKTAPQEKKESKNETKNADLKDKEEKEEKHEKEEPSIEEENETVGIPNLMLKVGDRYICHLSQKNKNDVRGGDMTWGTDNPFVGKINEYHGVFEALRVGKTFIECGADHIRIYYAEIKPTNIEWIGYLPLNDALSKTDINNVKTRNISVRIVNINDDIRTITYALPEGELTYQWDKKNVVTRVLMRIEDTEETRKLLTDRTAEFLERIKTDSDHPVYWIHKTGLDADYPESVDMIAFMKKSSQGKLYYGLGNTWRSGANTSEISENIDMIYRTFKDLLEPEDIPDSVGSKKRVSPKSTEPKKPRKKKPAKTPADKAADEASPIIQEESTAKEEQYPDYIEEGSYNYYEEGTDPAEDNFQDTDI